MLNTPLRSNILINYFCATLEYLSLENNYLNIELITELKGLLYEDKYEINLEIFHKVFSLNDKILQKGETINEIIPVCFTTNNFTNNKYSIIYFNFDKMEVFKTIIKTSDYYFYLHLIEKELENTINGPFTFLCHQDTQ